MSTTSRTAMVADDQFHVRLFAKQVLKSLGFEVVAEAANGNEAVAFYKEKKPSLVLLDVSMPLKNGDDALAEIRAADPDARVIMLTSMTDEAIVARCLELGAANYVRKDAPVAELQALIRATMGDA